MLRLGISDLLKLVTLLPEDDGYLALKGCFLRPVERQQEPWMHSVLLILVGLCYKVAGQYCSLFLGPPAMFDINYYPLLFPTLCSCGFWPPVLA